MIDKVRVISADLDGAELRRERIKSSHFARCDGTEDNEQIQDAVDRVGGSTMFVIPAERWLAIFGGR